MPHHRRHVPHSDAPKVKAYFDRLNKRADLEDHIFRRTLHILERLIAVITIIGLVAALGLEVYKMCTTADYFLDINIALHHLLTLVVGVEFVRMLIDNPPSNILEVLTVAITRHVILSHDDYWSNLICIACIAGLFAIRRYLVRRSELKEEMVEIE